MQPASERRIRRAAPHDAEALTALMHASAAYRGPYASILRGYAISAAQIGADHPYLIERHSVGHDPERGAELLGFYSLTLAASGAELDLMFVADAAQGQGVGAALFAHMRDTAQALGCAQVTIVSHPPAEAFYRRMGAVRVGTRPPSPRAPWERPILRLAVGTLPPR